MGKRLIWPLMLLLTIFSFVSQAGAEEPSEKFRQGGLSAEQQRQLKSFLGAARRVETSDPIKAWLLVNKAYKLEQYWTNNTLADPPVTPKALEQLTERLVTRKDGALIKILHSRQVSMNDKLNLIRRLEDSVVLTHEAYIEQSLGERY